METDYKVGQPLVVELENEILIGNLKLVSPDGRMIELTDVRDFNTGYVYTSSQCLPRPLIKSIKKCKTTYDPDLSNSSEERRRTESADGPTTADLVNITSSDIDQIQSLVSTAIYIFQTDQKYHKAIADIKHQLVIGLHMEPTQFGRINRTSLLAVATSHMVYIFDVISLGKIFKELKNILQSQRPKKIVYFSNKIADNLKYQHNVELTAVFDIYVAHCLISKEKTAISFSQCVSKYFHISEDYFQEEGASQNNIYSRPVPQSNLDAVSKKVVYLHKLYEHMLHDIMLSNFYNQCNDFSLAFAANEDNVEVVMQMKPNTVHGTDCIGDKEWVNFLERKLSLNST